MFILSIPNALETGTGNWSQQRGAKLRPSLSLAATTSRRPVCTQGRPRGSPRIGACLHGSCMAPRGMAGLPGPRFTAAITGPCRGPLSRVSARRACGRSRRRASMQDHLARSPQAGACHPGWNTAQSATTPRPVSRCTMGATGSWTGRSSRARGPPARGSSKRLAFILASSPSSLPIGVLRRGRSMAASAMAHPAGSTRTRAIIGSWTGKWKKPPDADTIQTKQADYGSLASLGLPGRRAG